MPEKSKRLRVMAGPNGSGKSTVLRLVRNNFYSGPFVNADEIEKSFKEKGLINPIAEYGINILETDFTEFTNGIGKSWIEKAKAENTAISLHCNNSILLTAHNPSPYDAALAADFMRYKLLDSGETFTFETVLSHPSKVEFLKESNKRGFKNYLYFICTVSPGINIKRVKQREQLGGHSVLEERIIKRYLESLNILPHLIPLCHRTFLFDNSTEESDFSIEPVAEIDKQGRFIPRQKQLPWWILEHVVRELYPDQIADLILPQ
ncbi:MAG: hypothetical protein P0Y53_03655 [Candidatus Pseudobacter hemicellulosilyticus]|uniref:UDP-N-acetylglucosamine kinase n=1 Tax=Candidatus Pseudobacter hemicellulosilyticus TaxID=3121375 RepID=A0AAJ5WT80_9BACT|nr:MAG: hypothetical protein P0Y53_03655 [Pseudobacter sp.]